MLKITVLILSLLGCASTELPKSDDEKQALESLSWVEHARPEVLARQALQRQDYRLMSFAMRGLISPGVSPVLEEEYQALCGTKVMPGTGDVIRGQLHRQWRNKAREIASEYNQVILAACLSKHFPAT